MRMKKTTLCDLRAYFMCESHTNAKKKKRNIRKKIKREKKPPAPTCNKFIPSTQFQMHLITNLW